MPEERFESDWPFPQRLPLGAGWTGTCTAPGHDGARPSEEELKSGCNIGYAKACSRLPAERNADAVRFALGEERDGILHVLFACEREYLPAGHGELLYDTHERIVAPGAHGCTRAAHGGVLRAGAEGAAERVDTRDPTVRIQEHHEP